jgi:hypothetical protein
MSASSSGSSGIGILGLLGTVFVVLKLTGSIDWSWWYVTLPFWGGFAILIGIVIMWFIGWLILHFAKKAKKSKQ